jgi:hypothetical protein
VLRKERPADGPLKQEVIAMRKRMMDAKPNHSALFDLKQDPGGMIDIEFIVQFLVLQHAARYPQLTANAGNIALLRMFGELGLISAERPPRWAMLTASYVNCNTSCACRARTWHGWNRRWWRTMRHRSPPCGKKYLCRNVAIIQLFSLAQ